MLRHFMIRIAALWLAFIVSTHVAHAETTRTRSKGDVLNEIIALTLPSLPVELHRVHFDQVVALVPEFVNKTIFKSMTEQIDQDAALSEVQKAALKAELPDLLRRARPSFQRIVKETFGTVDTFLLQGLKDDLTPLSLGEIIEVHTFLTSDAGKSYLKMVKTVGHNTTSGGKPKPLEIEGKHQGRISDFLNSEAGKKYHGVMLGSSEDIEKRIGQMVHRVFTEINDDPELDRMYEEFRSGI